MSRSPGGLLQVQEMLQHQLATVKACVFQHTLQGKSVGRVQQLFKGKNTTQGRTWKDCGRCRWLLLPSAQVLPALGSSQLSSGSGLRPELLHWDRLHQLPHPPAGRSKTTTHVCRGFFNRPFPSVRLEQNI